MVCCNQSGTGPVLAGSVPCCRNGLPLSGRHWATTGYEPCCHTILPLSSWHWSSAVQADIGPVRSFVHVYCLAVMVCYYQAVTGPVKDLYRLTVMVCHNQTGNVPVQAPVPSCHNGLPLSCRHWPQFRLCTVLPQWFAAIMPVLGQGRLCTVLP